MRRILLTGAGGFVGHHTLEHLLINTDWEVVCTDSFRHRGKIDRVSEVISQHPEWKERVDIVVHDLTVPISQQTAEKIGDIDAIISMASESHVDRSIVEPASFVRNNVELILTLLEYHRHYQPQAVFLQVSTDEVYGPAPDSTLHHEWASHIPSNPYAASKAAQTDIAISYWRTYQTPLILTQTMNIIGERQDTEKYVPQLIKKIEHGHTVNIHASPEGVVGSRFYLHARNQADALMFLVKRAFEGDIKLYYPTVDRPARFNVVGEVEIDNLELAELVAKSVGKPLKYNLVDYHTSRPGHDLRYALDGRRLAEEGWSPPVRLLESLHNTVLWTLRNPRWMH